MVPLAAILTGGKARRMGSDKTGLVLGGKPLLERVWEGVTPLVGRVIAVGGQPSVEQLGITVVPDHYPGADSMGGIATGLEYAVDCFGEDVWMLALACDLPFLEPALLQYLSHLCGANWDIVVPRVEAGYEPLCAFYRTTCLPVFQQLLRENNLRIRDVFRSVRTREVAEAECREYDSDLCSFLNINRPDDLQRARQILGE